MMITANNGFIEQSERYAFNNAGESLKKYILLKKGELAYNHGASKLRPYGSCFALTTAENARIPFVYHCFSAENQNAEFMSIELNGAEIENQLRKIVSSGARMDGLLNISFDEYTSVSVILPGTEEQDRIADFFRHLDNLITLHQRKYVFLFGFFQAFISMIFTASTFSWEQRKFDEVFDCSVPNNTLSRAELSYDEGTVLNVHYGDVLIKYGSVLDVQKDDIPRIPHRCREDFNGALLQDGDVIIADTAEDETTGKACEIGNLQGSAIVSGLHTMVCRPRNRMALGYLGYYLNSNAYHHQLLPLMQGIKVLSLSRSNIQKTSVSYPIAVKEQQLIAYYFSQLDNLITLHQRQPFLHSTPEISLTVQLIHPFYTSSWEQRKVGDLLIERNQQAPMSDEYPLMAFIANEGVAPKGERYDRSALVTDTVNKLYKKTEKGDFIYSSNNLETGSIGLNKYGKACISPVYSIFEPTGIADSDFLGRRLVRKDFINAMVKWRQGVIYGQWRIHESDFLKIEITVPSVEEQRKIGTYLDQLDHLITLHQRKGKAAVTGCSNDANNSKGVYCKARDFGYKCYKKVKSQQIRCLIAVFIFFV